MAQIKVLDLDNASSLSELSCEDINIVRGGYAVVFAATKNHFAAYRAYKRVLKNTGSKAKAGVASLSTSN